MRAAVLRAFGEPLEIADVSAPEPGPDQVLVRVRAAGICATDLKLIDGKTGVPPPLPHIPGHEVAGEVVEATGDLATGQRVACFILDACGHCRHCERGYPVLCEQAQRLGLDKDGGMAELVAVPRATVLSFPDSVPFDRAAVAMDSVMTPYYALYGTGVLEAGEHLVVAGVGGLGINAVQLAVAAGAHVAAVDVSEAALEAARRAGAELAVVPADADRVVEWAGDGADITIELSGTRGGFDVAAATLRPGGRLVCCGYSPGVEYGMDSARLVLDNIRVLGSRNSTRADAEGALAAIADGDVTPLIAERLPLEAANEALTRLAAGGVTGRLVLEP